MRQRVYGEDLEFTRIYEMIKMGIPISFSMKEYFDKEKDNYELGVDEKAPINLTIKR